MVDEFDFALTGKSHPKSNESIITSKQIDPFKLLIESREEKK